MIKLSMTLNGETLEKEFANEKELIAAADEMKKSRRNGELHFKDRLHREFYEMIQDNADGYRMNTCKELDCKELDKKLDKDDDNNDLEDNKTKSKDDLGFVKKAKVSAAEQAHTADAVKSASKASTKHTSAIVERKYKEALAAAQAETEEYQKTVARLSKELKEADEKHMAAKFKLEEAKKEYFRETFGGLNENDYPVIYPCFYDLLDSLFRGKDED